mgnify:FL=1
MTAGAGVVEFPEAVFIPGDCVEFVDGLEKLLEILFDSVFEVAWTIVPSDLGILFDLVQFASCEIIGRYVFELVEAVLHPGHMFEVNSEDFFIILLGGGC